MGARRAAPRGEAGGGCGRPGPSAQPGAAAAAIAAAAPAGRGNGAAVGCSPARPRRRGWEKEGEREGSGGPPRSSRSLGDPGREGGEEGKGGGKRSRRREPGAPVRARSRSLAAGGGDSPPLRPGSLAGTSGPSSAALRLAPLPAGARVRRGKARRGEVRRREAPSSSAPDQRPRGGAGQPHPRRRRAPSQHGGGRAGRRGGEGQPPIGAFRGGLPGARLPSSCLMMFRMRKEELHSSAVACVENSVRCCCCRLLLPGAGYHFLTSVQARSVSVNSSAALHFWYSRKNAAVKAAALSCTVISPLLEELALKWGNKKSKTQPEPPAQVFVLGIHHSFLELLMFVFFKRGEKNCYIQQKALYIP
ncbi:uncharacterized protein LOC110393495 [Numida meleagris]|uniref:uncharacterized protein LOC110393495 n=1 Tax=Numida meleagris TaxID=8996 RepID=UPI000B3E1BE7|nr:uncharacterized protein LOC110393495 [Numida meleagris]